MKKAVVLLLIFVVTTSCKGEVSPPPVKNDCLNVFVENTLLSGSSETKLALGYSFYDKKECPLETRQLFESAIRDRNHEAAVALGNIFFDQEDYLSAAFNYLKALHMGSKIEAPYMLGRMSEEGLGTKRNYDKAFEYYSLAANEGDYLAQVREYEKAILSMTHAISLNPELHTAVFQLGLLYLNQGQPDQAAQTWSSLTRLPENDSLRLFSFELRHLTKDEFTQCKSLLERGVKNNQYPILNCDMQKILMDLIVLDNSNTSFS